MTRRVTAPTAATLLGIGTFAVPDLTEEQRAIVHRCLKDYDGELAKQRAKLKNEFGIGDDLYTPIDRQLDIMRGVVTNESFGKRVGGLLDFFKSDSEATSDQLEMEQQANESEKEHGGQLKRHIEHSDGPPRATGKDAAAGENVEQRADENASSAAEAPSVEEIEEVEHRSTLEVIAASLLQDDADVDALGKIVSDEWTPEQRARAERYADACESFDKGKLKEKPKLPRFMWEAFVRTSESYRNDVAHRIPSEEIDDNDPTSDLPSDHEIALSVLDETNVKLTEKQLEALRFFVEGQHAEVARVSETMLKKLAKLGVINKSALEATDLGRAYIKRADTATNEVPPMTPNEAVDDEAYRDDDASDESSDDADSA